MQVSAGLIFMEFPIKEGIMSLDKVVVLVLALILFGGVAFLAWKNKQTEQKDGIVVTPSSTDTIGDDPSKKLQEKNRKHSKH